MRSKIAPALATLLMAVGLVGLVAAPASAAPAAPVVSQADAIEGWVPIAADLPRVALGMTPEAETQVIAAIQARFASDCIYPRHCVWTNYWYNGAPAYYWTISTTPAGGYCIPYAGFLNDNVDSAVLRGGRSATLYEHADCLGTPVFFLARNAYGGPEAGACGDYAADNWACSWSLPGKLPSSVWVIRTG